MFNFLVLSWALSFGYVPNQTDCVQGSLATLDKNRIATFATVEAEVTAWDRIYIYGSIETFQYSMKGTMSFNPYRADYVAGADLYLTDWLAVGIVHECDHPVMSVVNTNDYTFASEYNYIKSETKMFVKIGNNGRNK